MATTNIFLNPPVDRAADADLVTFTLYHRDAQNSGIGERYYEFLSSLAGRESVMRSAIQLRAKSVSNVHVVITPGRASSEADRNLARQNVDSLWTVWDDLDTFDYFRHTAYGLPTYGLSATEIEWRDNTPINLVTADQRGIGWINHRGMFGSRQTTLPENTILVRVGVSKYEPLRPGSWLVTQNSRHGSPVDWPDIRGCVAQSLFMINGIKSWVRFVDKFGIPLLMAEVADGLDDEGVAAVKAALAGIQSGDIALLNKLKDKVTIKTVDGANIARVGSSDVQSRLIDSMERMIDRVITGGTLNQSTGAKGSYTLGSIHADAASAIYSHDLSNIENTLNHQLIKPWYQRNAMTGPRPQIGLFTMKGGKDINNSISSFGYVAGQTGQIILEDPAELERLFGFRVSNPEPENSDE